MPRINYRADGFPPGSPSHLTGSWHYIEPIWNDIVWAAASVGKNGFLDVFAHGPFSLDEMRFRTYMMYANLRQVGTNLARSGAYDDLDPSEKGAVSFFFGMAFAKLAAEFLLNVPWLIHLEKLRRICPVSLAGRSRPDLVGKTTSGEWVVVEAKGRTNSYSQEVMNSAKTQSLQIHSIDGTAPILRVASQVYFSPSLEIRLRDPNDDNEGHDLNITPLEFLKLYYDPFMRMSYELTRKQLIEGQPYVFADFQSLGVSIGIHEEVKASLADQKVKLEQLKFERQVLPATNDGGSLALYRDGLAVQLGPNWSEDSMHQPPEERRSFLR